MSDSKTVKFIYPKRTIYFGSDGCAAPSKTSGVYIRIRRSRLKAGDNTTAAEEHGRWPRRGRQFYPLNLSSSESILPISLIKAIK
jgi:hypothetical protein